MKLQPTLTALASGLILSACASRPYIEPTVITRAVPMECTLTCPEPAPLVLHRQAWEAETVSRFLSCRALHNDCVEALNEH
ncbi:MAG: hypothetical protein RBR77_04120 [Thauera sp.]|jgi:hypothetical protein|nr:hypothetical protein [Thauera sp.]